MPTTNERSGSASVPSAQSAHWFTEIQALGSAAALRAFLAERHPGLEAGTLRRMAIIGAAAEGHRLIELCDRHGIQVVAVCDDNPLLCGRSIRGHTVAPVASLARFERALPVVIASHRPASALARLTVMGFQTVAPFMALQSLAPERFPPHPFHHRLLDDVIENGPRYSELFSLLADDTSRRHLDAVLGFRLTADINVLAPIVDPDLYCPAGLFTFSDQEVYVDGGVFDGDSIRLFLKRVHNRFSRIIGLEPDPITFQRLSANFSDHRITLINAGLHSAAKTLRFNNDASRAAAFDAEGAIEMPVVGLDEILNGDRVTTVKMNIEGSELEALAGARQSIETWAPKLAISAYHRPTDLWQVLFHMRSLNPDYRLYLRQHDTGIVETVAYALAP